jgi:hypothetical protein
VSTSPATGVALRASRQGLPCPTLLRGRFAYVFVCEPVLLDTAPYVKKGKSWWNRAVGGPKPAGNAGGADRGGARGVRRTRPRCPEPGRDLRPGRLQPAGGVLRPFPRPGRSAGGRGRARNDGLHGRGDRERRRRP